MKYCFLPILLALAIGSCDSPDQLENRSANPAEADSVLVPGMGPDDALDSTKNKAHYVSRIIKTFSDFQQAVYNEDAEGVNAFIDPKLGMFIIENPGALPKMTWVQDIRKFKREFQGLPFFTIKERLKTCQLKEETLPTFTCDDQSNLNAGYSKEGCFVADAEAFRNSTIYKFASLTDAQIAKVEEMLPLVEKTVLQTSSSYRFHFGLVNGKWRLLFADLRIPCSA